jgi:hypothetical protein
MCVGGTVPGAIAGVMGRLFQAAQQRAAASPGFRAAWTPLWTTQIALWNLQLALTTASHGPA